LKPDKTIEEQQKDLKKAVLKNLKPKEKKR
jgi:hypothetical protein